MWERRGEWELGAGEEEHRTAVRHCVKEPVEEKRSGEMPKTPRGESKEKHSTCGGTLPHNHMAPHAPGETHAQEPAPAPPFVEPAPSAPSANRAAHFQAMDEGDGNPQKRYAHAHRNTSQTSNLGGYMSSSRMQASSYTPVSLRTAMRPF
ncbi:hypothetical protein HOY80DRAFT_1020778 [Tuber brumale]|nr:hypothetical protein HOY80DRAFT_1020778 [Tuber brumale]